ncbi:hypothetical protein [Calothrix sp. PCC 7507]|uniref:hypothetical protein n=1 Tax=Calothrix sp. PCC 7507 TaxID=99598 RepID=UPI00029F0A8D|nr:hypothetical protein [Calothrix sp. PCC 7507]AFY32045.1 hypothetical protein Cal7507_1586 [Calothrix sp. PCC 7507]
MTITIHTAISNARVLTNTAINTVFKPSLPEFNYQGIEEVDLTFLTLPGMNARGFLVHLCNNKKNQPSMLLAYDSR